MPILYFFDYAYYTEKQVNELDLWKNSAFHWEGKRAYYCDSDSHDFRMPRQVSEAIHVAIGELDTTKRYCSNACRQSAYRDRQSPTRGEPKSIQKHCLHCGKSFTVTQQRGSPRKYCSVKCRVAAFRDNETIEHLEKD